MEIRPFIAARNEEEARYYAIAVTCAQCWDGLLAAHGGEGALVHAIPVGRSPGTECTSLSPRVHNRMVGRMIGLPSVAPGDGEESSNLMIRFT